MRGNILWINITLFVIGINRLSLYHASVDALEFGIFVTNHRIHINCVILQKEKEKEEVEEEGEEEEEEEDIAKGLYIFAAYNTTTLTILVSRSSDSSSVSSVTSLSTSVSTWDVSTFSTCVLISNLLYFASLIIVTKQAFYLARPSHSDCFIFLLLMSRSLTS